MLNHNDRIPICEPCHFVPEYHQIAERLKEIFKDWFLQMKKPNEWKPELWQNVQFWDKSLPPAKKVGRSNLR